MSLEATPSERILLDKSMFIFPFLSYEKRPLMLYKFLEEEPSFFVEILSHVFSSRFHLTIHRT